MECLIQNIVEYSVTVLIQYQRERQGLLSYYMGISIDYLIPELEPDEDERYIKNLKTRGDLYSRRILDRLKKNTEPSSEADKTISECVGKMLSVKDESLKICWHCNWKVS